MPTNSYVGQYSYRDEVFHTSDSPTNIPSLTPASTLGSSLDASPSQHTAGDDVLDGTLFPELKNDEDEDLEEHQKEDPLGVDMWRFYKKQSRLPDAGRMENMTWRMMAINLRKSQQRKQKYVLLGPTKKTAVHVDTILRASRDSTQHSHDPDINFSTRTQQSPTTTHPHPGSNQARQTAYPQTQSLQYAPLPAAPETRLDTHSLPIPSDYQYGYTPDTPHIPHDATTTAAFQPPPPPPPHHHRQPPPPDYALRTGGPRGHITVPPTHEPQVPAAAHARHVSLGPEYLQHPRSSGFHAHRDCEDVVPWDPGWAEEAFGGQPLYGGAPRQGVKREEVEPAHVAGGDWLFAGVGVGGGGVYGGGGGVGQQQQQQQPAGAWQRFEESHYAEVLEEKPQFGAMSAPGQYGQEFGRAGFGAEGSVSGAPRAGYQQQRQQQRTWGQGSSFVVAGRKRRKGQ